MLYVISSSRHPHSTKTKFKKNLILTLLLNLFITYILYKKIEDGWMLLKKQSLDLFNHNRQTARGTIFFYFKHLLTHYNSYL